MLAISRTAVALDGQDLLELERIMVDGDGRGAWQFLKVQISRQVQAVISVEGH